MTFKHTISHIFEIFKKNKLWLHILTIFILSLLNAYITYSKNYYLNESIKKFNGSNFSLNIKSYLVAKVIVEICSSLTEYYKFNYFDNKLSENFDSHFIPIIQNESIEWISENNDEIKQSLKLAKESLDYISSQFIWILNPLLNILSNLILIKDNGVTFLMVLYLIIFGLTSIISSNFMKSIYMKRNKTLSKYSKYLKWLIDQLKEFKINKKFVKFQNEFKSYNLKSINLSSNCSNTYLVIDVSTSLLSTSFMFYVFIWSKIDDFSIANSILNISGSTQWLFAILKNIIRNASHIYSFTKIIDSKKIVASQREYKCFQELLEDLVSYKFDMEVKNIKISGESGSGKSVYMNQMIKKLSNSQLTYYYCSQSRSYEDALEQKTIFELLTFGMNSSYETTMQKFKSSKEKISNLINKIGLDKKISDKDIYKDTFGKLSGGEVKKLQLLEFIIPFVCGEKTDKKCILFLDEIYANLDSESIKKLDSFFNEIEKIVFLNKVLITHIESNNSNDLILHVESKEIKEEVIEDKSYFNLLNFNNSEAKIKVNVLSKLTGFTFKKSYQKVQNQKLKII